MAKPCGFCESTQHTSFTCRKRPTKPMKRTAMKTVRKLVNRVGPVTAKWIETRNEWIQQNPPDSNGEWNCYFPDDMHHPLCPRRLDIDTMTLDHKKSRSRHPELRFVLSNLGPASYPCNGLKGSKNLEEFIEWRIQKPGEQKLLEPISESMDEITTSSSEQKGVGGAELADFTT